MIPGVRNVWVVALVLWAGIHCLLYAAFTPLWQAPDEPTHVEYACLLAARLAPLGPGDFDAALDARLVRSLAEHDFWRWVREPTPDPLPLRLFDDPFFRRSGRQVGDEPPAYYLLPALICRLPLAFETAARSMRLVSALFYTLSVPAALWAARVIWPQLPFMTLATGATVAGIPMLAFLGGGVNNDNLVVLLGMVSFGLLMRLVDRRRWIEAVACLIAAFTAVLIKKTALFLLPLSLVSFCWWLFGAVPPHSRRRFGITLALLAAIAGGLLLLPTQRPASWTADRRGSAVSRTPAAAHSGSFGARLVDDSTETNARLIQRLPLAPSSALSGRQVVLSAWVRAPQPGLPARLTVRDGDTFSSISAVAGEDWQRLAVTHTIGQSGGELAGAIAIGGPEDSSDRGLLFVDELSLTFLDQAGVGGGQLLRNPDFERVASAGASIWNAVARPWLAKLRAPAGEPDAAQGLLYLALLFPAFWGNFGWLQVPMPTPVYVVLAAVCALALPGLFWPRRHGAPPILPSRFVPWLALGLGMALLLVVALPMWQRGWQPQARYLGAALFPMVVFLVSGLFRWLGNGRSARALVAFGAGLLLLDAYAFLGVMVRHYYGF